ncbi:TonB-dependent siderophore receptor [Methylomonas sp. TEB]|uniref:TonB-dependent siderophore receptor n=1 Tax=Methylomonas sp. TEB TaxID=3398229 RepID=UPI0039F567DF
MSKRKPKHPIDKTSNSVQQAMTGLVLATSLAAMPALAAETAGVERSYHISSGTLSHALSQFAGNAGIMLSADARLTDGKTSQGLEGEFTVERGLQKLLVGTGLTYTFTAGDAVAIKLAESSADVSTLPAVRVEGKAVYDSADPYNPDYNRRNASTATKIDTALMETPMSVQVIPQAVIRDQQAFRLQDALKNVSGVQQKSSNGGTTGGADAYVVRGFELGFRSNYYRNGIRMQKSSADFANLDRVEVVKGPASGLYGRIEAGGLINVVTKKPLADPYYSIEQRFGFYDYYRTEATATGPVTDDKSLAYRLDMSYLDSNSFRDNVFNDRIFFAPSLSWKPTDRTELNLSVEYLDDEKTYDSGLPVTGNRVAPAPISRTFAQQGLADKDSYWLVDFNWSHSFNDNWKIRNGMVIVEGDANLQETYADGKAAVNGDTPRGAWFGGLGYDTQTVYLDLTGKFNTFGIDHNMLIGGDYYHQRTRDQATARALDTVNIFQSMPLFDVQAAMQPPFGYSAIEDNEWFGVYGQDEITLWDKLHVMGGLRYDISTYGYGYSDQNLALAGAAYDDIEENNLSPRVGILYEASDWLSLYGHYVESFGANNGRQASGKPFAPQTSEEFEGGIKTSFFDGKLTSTLAYYHLTKQNVLTPDPVTPNLSVAIGEARSQGLEWDVSGQLTNALSMIGTYAYTDTEITKDNSGVQGNRLPYAPLHSGSLWMKYDFQQDFLKGFSVGAGIYAAGLRYGDRDNSFYDDAYARLDLMAAYRMNIGKTRLTAQVNINNVSSTQYYIQRATWSNNPAEPLMAFGSIRLEY